MKRSPTSYGPTAAAASRNASIKRRESSDAAERARFEAEYAALLKTSDDPDCDLRSPVQFPGFPAAMTLAERYGIVVHLAKYGEPDALSRLAAWGLAEGVQKWLSAPRTHQQQVEDAARWYHNVVEGLSSHVYWSEARTVEEIAHIMRMKVPRIRRLLQDARAQGLITTRHPTARNP